MNRRAWYKRYPADFFDGCLMLSFEERGAYALVLDLIYMHGGPIPDNDRHISGTLSLSVRAWRNLRSRLVEKGKLELRAGCLSNRRADTELATAEEIAQIRASAGAVGGRTKAANAKLSPSYPEIIPTSPATYEPEKPANLLSGHDPPLANATILLAYARAGLESESERKLLVSSSEVELETRPLRRKRHKYPEAMEAFWREYPTDANMSKHEAAQAWQNLSDEDRTAAMASLPGFKAFCASNPTYRPIHANRYLLKRRFEGHLEQTKRMGERAEIHVGTAEWDAWRTYYRDNGKNFSVTMMDERARDRRPFIAQGKWPPGGKVYRETTG